MERRSNEPNVMKEKDQVSVNCGNADAGGDSSGNPGDNPQKQLQVPGTGMRPRSSSYSGRFPFFDFSMIPDKDPHFSNTTQ